MRSREVIAKLHSIGVPAYEIKACTEKHELLALLAKHQRGGAREAGLVAANPFLSTPPTEPKVGRYGAGVGGAKVEKGSQSARAKIERMVVAMGGIGASGIMPAIPLSAKADPRAKLLAASEELLRRAQERQDIQQMAEQMRRRQKNQNRQRSQGAKCSKCHQKARHCYCHLMPGGGSSMGGGSGMGMGGAGGSAHDDGGDVPSRAEEQDDLEVGLSHKDADEQTFTG